MLGFAQRQLGQLIPKKDWRLDGRGFFVAAAIASVFTGSLQVVLAADGDLDPTFGNGGTVVTDVSGAEDQLRHIALQADGKIVAVGLADINMGGSERIELVRYNADGTLDSTFGNAGKVITVIPGASYATAKSVVIQTDSKIVIAGGVTLPNTVDTSFILVRYNANGTLDLTFGNGGIVRTNIGDNRDSAEALALQPDGKLIAAGEKGIFRPPGEQRNSDIALVRYNPDGSLDPTFGNNGIVISDFGPIAGSFADDVGTVLMQPDGKIVIAGDSDGGGYYDFLVGRYNSNGTLDNTFGTNGFTKTDVGNGFEDGASDAVLQPDGKIILAGAANRSNAANLDFALLRYNPNGTLDQTFGNGGQTVFILDNLADELLTSVVLQADGKILALGDSNSSNHSGFLLFRFNTNGSLDTTFGTGGLVNNAFVGNAVETHHILLQPDGKLLAGGFTPLYNTSDFALARYQFGSLQMTGAVSRKTHGSAGAFDINLPLSGTPGVECRNTAANLTLVFTFSSNVVSGSASMVSGTATIAGAATYSGNIMTVNLTNVMDAQMIMLMLSNVTDSAGHVMPNRTVQVGLLAGDSNGDRVVNSGDALQTRNRSGQVTDATNFRSDVNADGTVNSGDTTIVRTRSGNFIP